MLIIVTYDSSGGWLWANKCIFPSKVSFGVDFLSKAIIKEGKISFLISNLMINRFKISVSILLIGQMSC